MLALDKAYLDELDAIAEELQASPELAKYLEEEEETDYGRLKEVYEPRIGLLYDKVSENDPLQLISFEERLLQEDFEGMYLPKILGYSVLRGEINEHAKYVLPQEHFKSVLMAICNSANFDILKKRIGQSIQMGFAFSSDIWITNLVTPIENRRIRYFLQGQKLEKYRRSETRLEGYTRYKRQFTNHNFMTAEFPKDLTGLKIHWSPLKIFLTYRINLGATNASIIPHLKEFVENEEFQGTLEHMKILFLYASYFELNEEDTAHLSKNLEKTRKKTDDFAQKWLSFVLELHNSNDIDLSGKADTRASNLFDKTVNDKVSEYYKLTDIIHGKGYISEEAQEASNVFYNQHEGLSLINECVRKTIFNYFARLLNNLEARDYQEFFELSKVFTIYMNIFLNQQFNQDVKDLFMAYVAKLLKKYIDKRGKDYQDIKKFVSSTFKDLGFLKDKEVVELFKTRRRKKKPE